MGKRSQRRSWRYKNDQPGCVWGLINLFDMRSVRSSRKLLSNKEYSPRDESSSLGIATKSKMLMHSDKKMRRIEKDIRNGEESEIPKYELAKTSVKELIEEELFVKTDSKNHIKSGKKINKGSNVENSVVSDEATNLEDLDLEGIIEELCQYQKRNLSNDLDPRSTDEKNLSEAIKVFIDQRIKEEAKTRDSVEFVDALKTLSSNKELFLNLLKEPNSPLVKHVQSIDDSRLGKGQNNSRSRRNFFRRRSKSQESITVKGNDEDQPSNRIVILKPGPTTRQNPNSEKIDLDDNSHSNNPVINERNALQSSFTMIRRKLKHVMGKEKISEKSRNPLLDERNGWSSPNRNHFYTEKFAKPYSTGKIENKKSKMLGVSGLYIEAKKHLSDMLTNGEEKELMTRQLPRTLGRIISLPEYNYSPWGSPGKSGEGEASLNTAQMRLSPRISLNTHRLVQEDEKVHLGLPNQDTINYLAEKEYSKYSCSNSHGFHIQDNPLEKEDARNSSSGTQDNLVEKEVSRNMSPNIQDSLVENEDFNHSGLDFQDNLVEEEEESGNSGLNAKENPIEEEESRNLDSIVEDKPVEIEESRTSGSNVEEENSLGSFVQIEMTLEATTIRKDYEEENDSLMMSDDKNVHTYEVCEEETYYLSINLDSSEEDLSFCSPTVSPSNSSQNKKFHDQDHDQDSVVEKTERPSPISVLEPFSDDEISPSTSKYRSAIQPIQIRFDEGICLRVCKENEESAFEYVEAVLLASGLNWDEYLSNRISSNQLLHPSLFDEVELFSNRPFDDQKLLFDCTNEVLEEIYEHYFNYSFIRNKNRPVLNGKRLINEVWEGVEWHLLCYSPSYSLDQLVKKEMMKTGSWMDLRFETDNLVIHLVNSVVEETIEALVISL